MKEGSNDFAQCSLMIGLIGDGALSAFGRLVFFFAVVNLLAQHSSASKVLLPALQTSRSQDAPFFNYVNLGYKVAQDTYNC